MFQEYQPGFFGFPLSKLFYGVLLSRRGVSFSNFGTVRGPSQYYPFFIVVGALDEAPQLHVGILITRRDKKISL